MNIQFETSDKVNGLMTITLETADYQPEVDKTLKDYRKRANIPGFRPGQAPMGMIKRQYGPAVKVDVVNKLLGEKLYSYIQDNKIVYDYRQRAADGTLCATAYDLASGTYSTVPSVVEDDGTSWPDLKPEFYWDGYLYFQSGSDIYRHPVMTDASSAEFWTSLSSYNMRSLQGIEEGKLFFTAFQDSDGVLYSMDVDTGTVTEISRHTAAGGGDAYFNW